jgi:HEPN domain-containing protein
MSLELLLKAIVVAKGGKLLHSHNLPQLAIEAAVPFTETERLS